MRKKVETKYFDALELTVDIFYFYDCRHNFYYVLNHRDSSVKSHCYPTQNICEAQLNLAICTLWGKKNAV